MAGEPVRRISPTQFRVARRGTSREINRQIALNLIRSKQPISRAELARLMGVRRGAVSRLVDELLTAGIVFEGAKGESTRGRKPMHLHIETRRRCVAAVDVSASHTAVLLTDLLGHPLIEVSEFPTRRRPRCSSGTWRGPSPACSRATRRPASARASGSRSRGW